MRPPTAWCSCGSPSPAAAVLEAVRRQAPVEVRKEGTPTPIHLTQTHCMSPNFFAPFTFLTYEWFVSHRWHADIDDGMRMQPSRWQTRPNTNREETGSLASVGRDDGGRGCADPVRRVWGCVAGHASGSYKAYYC